MYLPGIATALVFVAAIIVLIQSENYNAQDKEVLYLITGINGHKNLFASFLYLNLFFLLLPVKEEKRVRKYLRYTAIVITFIILILIRTKAVYLGLIASALIYALFLLLSKKNFKPLNTVLSAITALILLNVFILFAAPKIIERTLSYNRELSAENRKQKELDNERVMLWQKTYGIFNESKIAGVGPGNWQIYFPDQTLNGMWRAEDLNFTFQRPHNDLLWILSETGLIGFNLYFLFIIIIVIALSRVLKNPDAFVKRIALLSIAFISGYFVISFFDFPKERMEHVLLFNLLLAIAYDLTKQHFKQISLPKAFQFSFAGLSIPVLIVIGFRLKGEFNMRQLYDAKYKGENNNVLKYADKAANIFYSLDPTSIPVKWYSGNAHVVNANYEMAFADLKEAFKKNPFNRNVINDLGSAYAMMNKNDSAKIYYREAMRISPRFDDAKLNLSAIYIREQNFKAADSCLKTLLHDSPGRTEYQKIINAVMGN